MYFIDARTAETIAARLRNIAIAEGTGDSEQDALDLLAKQRKEWLLFFDNADDINLNLREYFPKCSHGNILITSRHSSMNLNEIWLFPAQKPVQDKHMSFPIS